MYLEDVSVELAELVLEGLALRQHALLVSEQPVLAHAHQLHLVGQTQDLVQFPLAAVLRRHLNLKNRKFTNQFSKLKGIERTLFLPRRRMSRMSESCASVRSYLERRSLNSSIGRLMMSSTVIGTSIDRARFSSRLRCSSSETMSQISLRQLF